MSKRPHIASIAALTTGFILFTGIGTITHELGHYVLAKLLGYQAHIDYGFTHLQNGIPEEDAFLIRLAGPLVTLMIGTTGFLLLLRHKQEMRAAETLRAKHWLFIFFSLFWLRQLFNVIMELYSYIVSGRFAIYNDETKIALHLGLHPFSISLATGLVAMGICCLLFFRYIPVWQRFPFLCAAAVGSGLGYVLWFRVFGPLLLPE